jgi:cation:H+ antiporter
MPESVVTLVAVTTGATDEAKNIGVGAAMGGPLALATVAYGVIGAMLLLKRRKARALVLVGAGMLWVVQPRRLRHPGGVY